MDFDRFIELVCIGGDDFERRRVAIERGPINLADRYRTYERDNYKCVVCGCGDFSQLTIDHITAIKNGGESKEQNYITMCANCNIQKKDKPLLELLIKKQGASVGIYDLLAESGFFSKRMFGEKIRTIPCDDAVRIGIKKALEE